MPGLNVDLHSMRLMRLFNQFIIYYHPNIIDGTSIKSGDVVVLDVDGKTDVKAG